MRVQPLLVILLAGLSGCARPLVPTPSPVRELRVEVPADAQMPIVLQFRERNVLVVDLTSVASQGSLRLLPGASGRWPVRLALRFQPGRFEAVEVTGAQRVVFPVTGDASGAATVDVPTAVHAAGVAALTVRWGPRTAF